jgi:gluconate 2-dehydrogenase gamma chain
MSHSKTSRRGFLAESGKLASAGWLALNTPMLLAAGHAAQEHQASGADWVNMTPGEALNFAAVVDQIIPPDDTPGAADAGVVYFIDNVLGGFMAGAAPMLKQGLVDLDAASLASFPDSNGYASLSFDQQTGLLEAIETTPFFNTMIFLTNCGMFALPSWGGNKDRSGWALVGFDDRHAWQPPFGYYDALVDAGENLNEQG